jgi:hypothetical protein
MAAAIHAGGEQLPFSAMPEYHTKKNIATASRIGL